MPDTKKPARSQNILFHIPVFLISKIIIVLFLLLQIVIFCNAKTETENSFPNLSQMLTVSQHY